MNSSITVTVINGPNLASLGTREPEHYGSTTEADLIDLLERRASAVGISIEFFQSDIEGEIVQAINLASGRSLGLIINPAAYSHYSIAIMDAMKAFDGPVVEVHISRVFSRESIRSSLVTAQAASAFISGAGVRGYLHALDILQELAEKTEV